MKNRSIKQWITMCFSLILLLYLSVTAVWNYSHTYAHALDESVKTAIGSAAVVRDSLSWWEFDDLLRTSANEQYQEQRDTLRALCRSFGFEYLYVYTIDPETEVRRYLFCVAGDDDKDAIVRRERYLGAISDAPLDNQEKAILSGERSIQMGQVSTQYGDDVTWLAPYVDEEGNLLALIGLDLDLTVENEKVLKEFLIAVTPVVLSLAIGLLAVLFLMRRRILNPIHELSVSMSQFARDSSVKPNPIVIKTQDEIGEIAASYEKMTSDISAYVNNIEALTQERVENNVQFEIARRIQYGLVPERTNLAGKGFALCAMTRPAKAVGGDFYDCFQRDENTVCAVLGDVSGKGLPAAIFMVMAKILMHEKLMDGLSPAEALNVVNDALCAQNPEGLFATAFALVFDPVSGQMRFANAGHTRPVLIGSKTRFLTPDSGIALGLFEDAGIRDESLELKPGEGILIYTDGVTEAVNPQRMLFGEAKLLEVLKEFHASEDSAAESVKTVKEAVDDFANGREPFDDTAILALFHTEPAASREWKEIPVELSSFEELKKGVFSRIGETVQARKILLACDEALTNIVSYSGAADLMYCCETEGEYLCVGFSDNGKAFDPTASQNEEMEFDLLDSGGMGLVIIANTASSMNYERKDGRNILLLHFRL